MDTRGHHQIVTPAKAGVQTLNKQPIVALAAVPQIPCFRFWIPAFAGMTENAS